MTRSKQSVASHWPLSLLLGMSSGLNLFLPLVLVRLLTPDAVGFYKLFFLYVSTLPWITLSAGLGNGLYYWAGNKDKKTTAFSFTQRLQWYWALLLLALGMVVIATFWFVSRGASQTVPTLWTPGIYFLLLWSAALAVPSTFYEDSQVALGHPARGARFTAGFEVVRTIAILASAFLWRTTDAVVITHAVVVTLKAVIGPLKLRKHESTAESSNLTARPPVGLNAQVNIRDVLHYAFPSSLAAALLVVVNYIDQFVLGARLSAADFAAYSLGCLSVPPLLIFEQSVNKILIPKLAHLQQQKDSVSVSSIKDELRETIRELGMWLIPATVGLYFFAGPITRLLFTNRYPESEFYLKAYSITYLFFIFPYDAWARASGQTVWILKTTAIFAFLSIFGVVLGASLYGAWGALGAFILVQGLLRLYSLVAVQRELKTPYGELLPWKSLLRFLSIAVALGYLGEMTLKRNFTPQNEIAGLVLFGTLYWLIYIGYCLPWLLGQRRDLQPSRKVLVLTQFLNIGGLEKVIQTLCFSLQARGNWEPIVFVYDSLSGARTLDGELGKTRVIRWQKPRGVSPRLVFKIVKTCYVEGACTLHAHDMGAMMYAVLAKFLSFGFLRVVYTQHSFVHFKDARRYRYYEAIFARLANQICVVSPTLLQTYGELGITEKRIRTIENGVNFVEPVPDFEAQLQLRKTLMASDDLLQKSRSQKVWILNLARLHPGKGQDEVLNLFAHLPEQIRKKAVLFFVGSETSPGYLESLKKQQRMLETHLGQNLDVVFYGPSLQPQDWLRASDIFISASAEEGMPLAPIEALSAGLVVLLSDIAGHRILQGPGCEPCFFDLHNSGLGFDFLAKAIIDLTTSKNSWRREPNENSQLRQRFGADRMAQNYEDVYEDKEKKADL